MKSDQNDERKVQDEQSLIQEVVNHEGWAHVRQKLMDKILDLQNAFNIEDTGTSKMLVDLKARKLATQVLFDFLREIEGTAQQAKESRTRRRPSFIVNMESEEPEK